MVYVHFYYTKDLKKRKNQKILYSPENIKISFIFRHNPQDFGGMKSPSPALRGWGESQIPEKEKSVLVSENKFETEYTAAGPGFEPR